MQVALSLAAGGVLAFAGLLTLLLWVPGYDDYSPGMKQSARDRIHDAYMTLALAVLCAAFGLFFEAPLLIVIFVWMIHTIFKSIKIVRS
jgi:Sec-independent protein secretion pathway component TatC